MSFALICVRFDFVNDHAVLAKRLGRRTNGSALEFRKIHPAKTSTSEKHFAPPTAPTNEKGCMCCVAINL